MKACVNRKTHGRYGKNRCVGASCQCFGLACLEPKVGFSRWDLVGARFPCWPRKCLLLEREGFLWGSRLLHLHCVRGSARPLSSGTEDEKPHRYRVAGVQKKDG